ncbi:hypothetical protein Tco_0943451 [Tanacetum coccineum]
MMDVDGSGGGVGCGGGSGAATTASILEVEQDSGNITKGPDPRQHLMNQVPQELVQVVVPGAKKPWGILLLKLDKDHSIGMRKFCSLKRRVKKLERKRSSRTHKLKRLYKVGLTARVESSSDDESLSKVLSTGED